MKIHPGNSAENQWLRSAAALARCMQEAGSGVQGDMRVQLGFRIARAASLAMAAAVAAGAGGCAAKQPLAPEAPAHEAGAEQYDPGASYYEGDIGGLSEEEMDAAFGSLLVPVRRCLERGSARLDPLGGSFKLSLRIDRRGATRWAYLSESTLGDRDTEKCVLDAARAKTWPKPLSGEGLADKTFEMDPRKPPLSWDERRVRHVAVRARLDTAKCRKGIDGRFVATAYLGPQGRVMAAGVAPPSAAGEEAADCVVEAVKRLRFVSPGARAAKVSFEIR